MEANAITSRSLRRAIEKVRQAGLAKSYHEIYGLGERIDDAHKSFQDADADYTFVMLHLHPATVLIQRSRSVSNVRLPSGYMMSHKNMSFPCLQSMCVITWSPYILQVSARTHFSAERQAATPINRVRMRTHILTQWRSSYLPTPAVLLWIL